MVSGVKGGRPDLTLFLSSVGYSKTPFAIDVPRRDDVDFLLPTLNSNSPRKTDAGRGNHRMKQIETKSITS